MRRIFFDPWENSILRALVEHKPDRVGCGEDRVGLTGSSLGKLGSPTKTDFSGSLENYPFVLRKRTLCLTFLGRFT